MMVSGAYFFVVTPQLASATSAGPDVGVQYGPYFYDVSTNPTATQVDVYMCLTTDDGSLTMSWGNSSGEVYSSPIQLIPSGTYCRGTYAGLYDAHVYINYFQQQTTYGFTLTPPSPTCWLVHGQTFCYTSYGGSFTTPRDSSYIVSGNVALQGGGHPVGTMVQATCQGYANGNIATTDSNGNYVIYLQYPNCPRQVVVSAYSQMPSGAWIPYWNESVEFFPPNSQYQDMGATNVNFVLQPDYVSNYVPVFADFNHAAHASINVADGVGYDNSYTYSWTAGASVWGIGGGASGSTTSDQSTTVTTSMGVNGAGTVCYATKYDVSGTTLFNAAYRKWSFDQNLYNPNSGKRCQDIAGF